ncbi:hypothetical protein PoB_001407600 [Plakobranchus ocellatus]|uniref:Uncharacterized protein n=1 Tax=Plakobranchus ocellatus TaxID=259542 RepID=A0AAV3YVS4_9GAST|nr:hypothetical protein PoB_001407600 [Plakobranchus ocellatus]
MYTTNTHSSNRELLFTNLSYFIFDAWKMFSCSRAQAPQSPHNIHRSSKAATPLAPPHPRFRHLKACPKRSCNDNPYLQEYGPPHPAIPQTSPLRAA